VGREAPVPERWKSQPASKSEQWLIYWLNGHSLKKHSRALEGCVLIEAFGQKLVILLIFENPKIDAITLWQCFSKAF